MYATPDTRETSSYHRIHIYAPPQILQPPRGEYKNKHKQWKWWFKWKIYFKIGDKIDGKN